MRWLLKKKHFSLFAALLVAPLAEAPVQPAAAATATATFQVTATVLATCLITANPLAFGTYAGTQTDATTTLSVTCTNTTGYTVGLDAGTGAGATVASRRMTGPGSAVLTYGLFTDSARGTVWGNTVGTNTVAGTGSGLAQTLTVYGRVPASQFVAPGAYVDTVTATINF
jgi:spore coat protein U-like protein